MPTSAEETTVSYFERVEIEVLQVCDKRNSDIPFSAFHKFLSHDFNM